MKSLVTLVAYVLGTLGAAYLLDLLLASFFFQDVGRVVFPVVFAGLGLLVGVLHAWLRGRGRTRSARVLPLLLAIGLLLLFWKESRRYGRTTQDYGEGVVEGYRPEPPW